LLAKKPVLAFGVQVFSVIVRSVIVVAAPLRFTQNIEILSYSARPPEKGFAVCYSFTKYQAWSQSIIP
jgi:hypothetical protein